MGFRKKRKEASLEDEDGIPQKRKGKTQVAKTKMGLGKRQEEREVEKTKMGFRKREEER